MRTPSRLSILILAYLLVCHVNLQSQELNPVRTSQPPILDGVLDDVAWSTAEPVSGFVSYDPDYGLNLPFGTTVRMAFDEENLYFAFHCEDSEPAKIKASVDSRDQILADDWVCINLDTYNDQQVLSAFYINPYGIQMDSRFAAGREDRSIDFVWYSAGTVDSSGYSTEVRIPLKSLRFPKSDSVVMGVILERRISRLMMSGTYPALDPAQGMAFLNQMMPVNYTGIKPGTLLEIMPALTYSNKSSQEEGSMQNTVNKVSPSLTLKYGFSPQLVLDATVNPDFSQIEADAGQVDVNLRYQLYFPEKRLFFQEGSEHYTNGAGRSSILDPVRSMVHTRTIVSPVAGTKLSGRLGSKNSISLLYAADRIPEEERTNDGKVEHVPVFRYKRFLKEDGFVGGIYTGRISEGGSNHAGGADGQSRISPSTLLEYHAFGSSGTDSLGSTAGGALGLYLHSETRNFDYAVTGKHVSEDFRNDVGYITRTGISYFTGLIKPKLYPESSTFRKFEFELFSGQLRDNIYTMWETFNHVSVLAVLGPSNLAKVKYSYSTEIFLGEKFNTGGYHFMFDSQISKKLSAGILYRRIGSIYYSQDPYQGKSNNITTGITYLPLDKLHTDLSLVFQDFHRSSDGELIYSYLISRGRITYQVNKYLFFRVILEYNNYREQLLSDLLASFTWIPGTVLHIGYGSLFRQVAWNGNEYVEAKNYTETDRGLFLKASYLHRF